MKQLFLNKEFEFGGTLKNLDESKGNHYGVYIIVRPKDFGRISFANETKLKKWRNKVVKMPVSQLEEKYSKLSDANILYLGKSECKKLTNRKRVLEHIKFWSGKNSPAWGGRAIGQIEDWESLEAWYYECDDPTQMKGELLKAFKARYGDLPLANWRE